MELTLTLPQAVEVTNQVLDPGIAFSLCMLLGSGGFGGLINRSISLLHCLRTMKTACCTLAPDMAKRYAAKEACFLPLFCLDEATRSLLLVSSCTNTRSGQARLKQDWPQCCLAGADVASNDNVICSKQMNHSKSSSLRHNYHC